MAATIMHFCALIEPCPSERLFETVTNKGNLIADQFQHVEEHNYFLVISSVGDTRSYSSSIADGLTCMSIIAFT
jgi:hypothetical protein